MLETTKETNSWEVWVDLANERADEFENKYLRAHAEMQNIPQRRQSKSVKIQNVIVASYSGKANLPSLTPERN